MPKEDVKHQLAGGDPGEYDKLCMIDDLVEYEVTFYTLQEAMSLMGNDTFTLGEALATVKTSLREAYRGLPEGTVKRHYDMVFEIPENRGC